MITSDQMENRIRTKMYHEVFNSHSQMDTKLSSFSIFQESINRSLLNLLTYPWIEDRVEKGTLSLHGGYYDFADCTFEKWTLDCKGCRPKVAGEYSIKNREFWS